MAFQKGFPDNERTIVVDRVKVPEPVYASHSAKWFEKPELAQHSSLTPVSKAKRLQERARALAEDARKSLIHRNPYATQALHYRDWYEKTDKRRRGLRQEFEAFLEEAKAEAAGAVESVNYQLKLSETQRAAEVRSFMRGLKPEERESFIAQAIEHKDSETIAAIVNGPAYLAGLDGDRQHGVWESYAKAHAPEVMAKRDAVNRAKEIARQAVMDVDDYVVQITPAKALGEAEQKHEQFVQAVEGGDAA